MTVISNTPAQISISRRQLSDGQYIFVEIEDSNSGIKVAELKLDLESFSKALTGLSGIDCEATFKIEENVGKKKERKTIEHVVLDTDIDFYVHDRKQWEEYVSKNFDVEGWTKINYLGSRNSIVHDNDRTTLTVEYHRYV